MGRGDTITGTVPAGEAPLVPIPLLAGDEVDVVLQGTGQIELESFDPAGKPIGRTSGDGAVSSRFKTTQDGVAFVAILAEPGSSYSLSIKRVVTGRPPPPPVDPNWGNYARMNSSVISSDRLNWRRRPSSRLARMKSFTSGCETSNVPICAPRRPPADDTVKHILS